MSVGVRQKLEAELLIGDGGPGEILGFIAQAPAARRSESTRVESQRDRDEAPRLVRHRERARQ